MQNDLDEAIFELYQLSDTQKDLVRDLNRVTLEFFYNGINSEGSWPASSWVLTDYADSFADFWKDKLLARQKGLKISIFLPKRSVLCGIAFELTDEGVFETREPVTNEQDWKNWFQKLSVFLRGEYSTGIYIDRMVKIINDTSMLLIKRSDKRFWTRSQAYKDAQEFFTELLKL